MECNYLPNDKIFDWSKFEKMCRRQNNDGPNGVIFP